MKSFYPTLLAVLFLAFPASAADSDTRWHVVLAAVGNEQNVFDNFISDFASVLQSSPDIASLTELHASIDDRWQASGNRELDGALTVLNPRENEGCLVYLTGHGAPEGLAMSADIPTYFIRTTRMESMLNSCAGSPTVLVVSACFSGIYMLPGITRPERIVFTASEDDRTSFGCSNNNRYTFFDQCFMNAWHDNDNWGALGDEVRRCVTQTERIGNYPSSKPQFFYGSGMKVLALPAKEEG